MHEPRSPALRRENPARRRFRRYREQLTRLADEDCKYLARAKRHCGVGHWAEPTTGGCLRAPDVEHLRPCESQNESFGISRDLRIEWSRGLPENRCNLR